MCQKARNKIKRAEKLKPTVGSKWTHRGANHFVDPESEYWNCGSMKYARQSCAGLHLLGERNRQPGSTLTNPKFSDCCSSGNVTVDLRCTNLIYALNTLVQLV